MSQNLASSAETEFALNVAVVSECSGTLVYISLRAGSMGLLSMSAKFSSTDAYSKPKPLSSRDEKVEKQVKELSNKISKVITDRPLELLDVVKGILMCEEDVAKGLVGKTSRSGYMKIHSYIVASIDRVLEACKRSEKLDDATRNILIKQLLRAHTLVKYQKARDQLSSGLAEILENVLSQLENVAKSMETSKIAETFDSARVLLDAIAVLVYKHRGERE